MSLAEHAENSERRKNGRGLPLLACLCLLCVPSAASARDILQLLREVDLKDVNWLAVNGKGSELLVCAGSDVKVLDARTLRVLRTYRGAGRRGEFVLGERALLVSGVLRTGIELLDRKSGEATLLNYGEPDFQCQAGRDLLAYRSRGKDGPIIVVYDLPFEVNDPVRS